MQEGSLLMRKSRRVVVPLAVFALIAGAGLAGGLSLVAHANTQTFCDSSGTPITCSTDTETITSPSAITIAVTLQASDNATTADQYVVVSWTGDCAQGSTDTAIASSTTPTYSAITKTTGVSVNVPLPFTDPDFCDIVASATLYVITSSGPPPTYSTATTGQFQLELEYTPSSTPSSASSSTSTPSSVNVSYIKGYDSKCIDDKGNSSADRTKVIIWSCNHGDSAQGWTFTNGELKHNGMCANDAANGGSGTHLILWSCNGASNEKWFHSSSDGEFILSLSSHGLLCLDDPGYSKSNGTQLIVYTCHNSGNQHWT
jgi:Ricin-type beta-trefoil lectin domain